MKNYQQNEIHKPQGAGCRCREGMQHMHCKGSQQAGKVWNSQHGTRKYCGHNLSFHPCSSTNSPPQKVSQPCYDPQG